MKALRIGLCLLITFSVLAQGVVEVWSESILELGAAILLLIWAFAVLRNPQAKIRWNPLYWPLLGLIAIGLFQLLFHITAYPFLTRTKLLYLAVYFLVFFLSAQAFRERADLLQLAWFLMLFGFAVSLLGIIQHFTSPGEIYWVRDLPTGAKGSAIGPYLNRNHFAGFVELVLPTGLAMLIFRGLRRELFLMVGLLTIVPLGALILSASRGGIVGFGFEICVLMLLAMSRRRKEKPSVAGLAVVSLAALMLIAWLGVNTTVERFKQLRPGDVTFERRGAMFLGAARIFQAHPLAGTGLGTLVSVFPQYEPAYDGRLVDHVHNDYIELLADSGLLGGLCGFAFLWLLFREAFRNFKSEQGHFSRALHAGAVAALCGLLLHSFVDFNLQIPANAMLFLLQAFLATVPPLPPKISSSRKRGRGQRPILREVPGYFYDKKHIPLLKIGLARPPAA